MTDHKALKLNFSNILQFDAALAVIQKLQKSGHQAVIAGGAIRDVINQRSDIENVDIDIATSALPDEVENLFPQTVAVGKAYGVIRVIINHQSIEVATFRQDGPYLDGRRPETVNFSGMIEDSKRRDFTVNALFYDPVSEVLFDHVGGLEDLKNKTLKAVGDPGLRFQEDELRRLRLIRFVSQLGFDIEPLSFAAMKQNILGIKKVSLERITDEIFKMWKGRELKKAFPLFWSSGMAEVLNPGLDRPFVDESKFDLILKRNSSEIWLHYFLVMYGFRDLNKRFSQFKLSSEIQNNILKASKYFGNSSHFLSLDSAQQRIDVNDQIKAWVLDAQFEVLSPSTSYQMLKKELLNLGPLPKPLLDGHDVSEKYQGADRGRMLQVLYKKQIEENWQSREQALEALKMFRT